MTKLDWIITAFATIAWASFVFVINRLSDNSNTGKDIAVAIGSFICGESILGFILGLAGASQRD